MSGDVKSDGESWDIESLDLRVPGITQMRLSGRFSAPSKGVAFSGPVKIDSGDPRAFVAWLTDRVDPQAIAAGSLRLSGDVALGSETIAVDRLKAEVDRMTVNGRFAYSWTNSDRPARLDAALTAPEINIDRVHALAKAILGDTEFDRPREGALSLKIDRASVAGIEAKGADISMRLDANGLGIERLTIADFGGAMLAVKGRIDTRSQSPRGALTVDVEARALDGIIALIDRFSPQTAEQLRRSAQQVTPVRLRASISVESGATASANAAAKFKIDGRAGGFKLALQGDAGAASDAFTVDNLAALGAAKLKLAARIDADDGGALLDLIRLDRLVAADKRPGRLNLNASGPLDGNLVVDGQLVAGPLNMSANGMVRLANGQSPTARLDLKVANANIRSPRPAAAGKPAELLPTSLTARLGARRGHRLAHRRCRHGGGHQHRRAACGRPAAADAHRRRYRAGSNRAAGRDCRGDRDAGAERGRVALVRRAVRAAFGGRPERPGGDQGSPRRAHAQARGARPAGRVEFRRLGARAAEHRRRRWPAAASPAGSRSCVAPKD